MHLLCMVLCTVVVLASATSGKYFYIYDDWPLELQDVYPPPGATLDPKASYSHDFYENNGFGKILDGDIGMFSTWQFSLFKNVMARLRTSDRRTLDPAKASAFVVPYDAGVHSFIDHNTGKVRLASPFGWTAVEKLKEASKSPVLWHNRGHDHFVFFSVTGYQMVGIGTKYFFMNICQNCTVMTIETTPMNIAIAGRTHKYWYAVPYPSSFHWWEGIKRPPWHVQPLADRGILAIFIGSVKTSTANSNALRRALYEECTGKSANKLRAGIVSDGTVITEHCQWHVAAHACTAVVNASNTMLLYHQARYCLAPPGDSLTRKSLFDSFMTGCVPVIFARATVTQYAWFLSESEVAETTVFIPKKDVIDGDVKFLDVLKSISDEELLRKQQRIAEIAPRLQYSVVPNEYLNTAGSDSVVTERSASGGGGDRRGASIWSPPFRDAGEVIIERMLDPSTVAPMSGFSPAEVKEMQKQQRHRMETDPDFMGMGVDVATGAGGGKKRRRKDRDGEDKGTTAHPVVNTPTAVT